MTDRVSLYIGALVLTVWGHVNAAQLPSKRPLQEPEISVKDREHWAFRSLVRPPLPSVGNEASMQNPVDHFVSAQLDRHELRFAPPAGPRTLLRRLSFDLIGLPPAAEDLETFLQDTRPGAYERQVDRLLASPQYGERWAQHWLDLARYAETDGFEHDKVRGEAWKYRDWVIDSLNRDLPYDRFIRAQISGDEEGAGGTRNPLGTGFLLAGPDMPDINLLAERRHNVLNEMTSTVGAVFLGLGMGCAQCHDHKFDPISQADFYRLRAFFDNMKFPAKNKQLGPVIQELGAAPQASHLAVRGDFRRQGPEVFPGFPRILNAENLLPVIQPASESSSYRRSALADWITRDDHPLTSRVMANRVWQHHFGRALVQTPNDFGSQGLQPTHPALLDYLATELVRRDWSLKQLHRLIVTSRTYRQASSGTGPQWDHAVAQDPDNRWYSRMNRRRLSGESLRDAMLAISGRLNDRQRGNSDRPPLPQEVHATLLRKDHWQTSTDPADHHRRSIYVFVRRNLRYPIFDVFDRPDANASCAQRSLTTTAPQSLSLLNSKLSLDLARALAHQVLLEPRKKPSDALPLLTTKVLGRSPTKAEFEHLSTFLESANSSESGDHDPRLQALTEIALALFNLNEFLYID